MQSTNWVSWSLAFVIVAVTSGVALAQAQAQYKWQLQTLQQELEKTRQLRQQERKGRTKAEKQIREILQTHTQTQGYQFDPIGVVHSCFVDRRGTPRQGLLVPHSRARIQLRNTIPPAALDRLHQFSHLWVVFVFHENTNVSNLTKKTTFPAKIAPPRLNGDKAGVFSTRTPHRPNAIGLSVVRIESVHDRVVEISGHDLVDGTPVLDIKPYVANDCVEHLTCPAWVSDSTDVVPRPVEFTSSAQQQLQQLVETKALQFYSSVTDLTAAIREMLVLDIRSVHQQRGHASETIYQCQLDQVVIEFQTCQDTIQVIQCIRAAKKLTKRQQQPQREEEPSTSTSSSTTCDFDDSTTCLNNSSS